jgi:hypothetical protein
VTVHACELDPPRVAGVLAIAGLEENARTRAGDAGLGPSLVRRRPYHERARCHLHDRPTIHHPAVLSISLGTHPVVAALRVDAARDGCRAILCLRSIKASVARS